MQPLEGIRILDLTTAVSGPFAAMLLGDLGADVIKVEGPAGDEARHIPPHFHHGESAYFLSVSRNKRSLAIDLKDPTGRELFLELVAKCDVVFDNFRPGVLERLQLDREVLTARNPKLITCSLTGFGPTGPYANHPAFDLVIQAMSGGMSVTGYPGQAPARSGLPIGDLTGGLFAAYGMLGAITHRERTGLGQHVELSMLGSQLAYLTYLATYYLIGGEILGPQGAGHRSSVPYNVYRCRDGNWLVIAAHLEKFFKNFVRIAGRADLLDDPRFATRALRAKHKTELDEIVSEILAMRDQQQWLDALRKGDVPVSAVNTVAEVFSDPQVQAIGATVEIRAPDGRTMPGVRNPVKFSRSPKQPLSYPPRYGEHSEEVLRELLGLPPERVAQLLAEGIAFGPDAKS